MKAVAFNEFGGPDVLRVLELPEPHAGPGQARVRVKAAAEYIVVSAADVTPKSPEMPGEVAGGFTAGTQTASIALGTLHPREGETLLVHGAAGSVGTAAIQLAQLEGANVVGTASEANQGYPRELGATPVVYGEGLKDRIEAVAPQGIDVVLDGAGGPALDISLELVKGRRRILTLADHDRAAELGVLASKSGRSAARLAELAALYAKGDLRFHGRRVYPYTEAAAAHWEIETGHGRGKIVLTFS
jgi:NADPH:quinone reductase-like Zn-dependent oxidoreductase